MFQMGIEISNISIRIILVLFNAGWFVGMLNSLVNMLSSVISLIKLKIATKWSDEGIPES